MSLAGACYVNFQTIKGKSTDISSYFKKKSTKGGVKEMAGEQERLSNSEEEEEEERNRQSSMTRIHSQH